MARFKNYDWNLTATVNGNAASWTDVKIAVLMDIRDELVSIRQQNQVIVNRLNCSETLSIPRLLREIRKNTTKRRRKKAGA